MVEDITMVSPDAASTEEIIVLKKAPTLVHSSGSDSLFSNHECVFLSRSFFVHNVVFQRII